MKQTDVPVRGQRNDRVYGSDVIAEAIRHLKLDYLALNPGASFRGLHDSLVNYTENQNPKMLLCLHEENAVSIAHGYAKVAQRPMGVVLHSNVGLMHGSMGIFNAWCDRTPMVVIGATGPVDANQRRPWIDWLHTSSDQGALVRDFTKWDNQPASVPAAIESLARAYQITQTAPKAPVYVNLDSSLQEVLLEEKPGFPNFERYQPPVTASPSPEALAQVKQWLAGAKNTVILMGRVSRNEADWEQRVALAEALQAKVATDLKLGAAFPTAHPLHVGPPGFFSSPALSETLRQADVILSLDWVDLAGTLKQAFGNTAPAARIINVSMDQQLHRGWGAEYFGLPPADIYIASDADSFVAALGGHFSKQDVQTDPVATDVTKPAEQISIKAIADVINTHKKVQDISLVRLPLGWNGAYTHFDHPLDYLGYDGGGGIGSGPGMCVGAALALQGTGRLAVGILGDGDFLMGVTAIWSACHYGLPLLLVVANNRSFFNDEMHQERVAKERGRPVENRWIGQRISEPDIDLAAMARAQGAIAYGPVADIESLQRCMEEAITSARAGNVCVLDVRVLPGYDANLSGEVDRASVPRTASSKQEN